MQSAQLEQSIELTVAPPSQTAQQRFDAKYVCSSEIQKRLGVARTTLTQGRRRGMLPEPIVVPIGDAALYLWERNIIEPYLTAWELTLKARRRELPV
jgi:hypothetical protein